MADGAKTFVFTITAGRTGTAYLAELLAANVAGAEVHHEILGYDKFGVDTPDVSHLTLFNSVGNTDKVQAFWAQKLDRIAATEAKFYAETSHILIKAGLAENIHRLTAHGQVHFVILQRDPVATLMSYRRRHDFANKGSQWMWYLDPDYPRKIVDAAPLAKIGLPGVAYWYLLEIAARAAYYRSILAGRATFHEVDLAEIAEPDGAAALLAALDRPSVGAVRVPPPQNVGRAAPSDGDAGERESLEKLVAAVKADPVDLARAFLDAGRRL